MKGMVQVIQVPDAQGLKNSERDALNAALEMPDTLTGGTLDGTHPVGYAFDIGTTAINEGTDKLRQKK